MRNLQVKQRIMCFYKWFSFVILTGCAVSVFGQTNAKVSSSSIKLDSLSGVVRDAVTKLPVSGVQIQTIDAKYSSITDETGLFKIKFPVTQKTLIVVSSDYNTKEVPVFKNQTKKEIFINPSSSDNYFGNELTVSGTKRRTITPNAQRTVTIDNLSAVTLDGQLQRDLMGDIRMTKFSGSPASGASMLIRGINSMNASSRPLIVVDGVIYDNQSEISSIHLGNVISPLSNLDVNDIQSVSVLKDGTSLYGSKGGNGVLLIQTNRGRSVATKITASTMFGLTETPKSISMMDGDRYRIYLTDLLSNKDAQLNLKNQHFLNDDPKFIYYNQYHNNTDWTDGVYTNAFTQGYNVGVNGGDDVALYNLSVGFANGASTVKDNNFSRLNARFNSDIILTKNLSTAFDISYLQSSKQLRNDGLSEYNNSVVNSPAFLALVKAPFLNPYQFTNTGKLTEDLENYDFLKISNPYAILKYGIGKTLQNNFNLALTPVYKFNKNLRLSSRFSYTMNNLSENMYSPLYGVAPFDSKFIKSTNYAKTHFARKTSLFNDTRLNWMNNYGYHSFDVNLGVRYTQDKFNSQYAVGHNSGSDQSTEINPSLQYKSIGGFDDPSKSLSYFSVINYSLRDKYLLQGTVSTETNSRFGADAESGFKLMGVSWGVFPALNAAWLVSSEDFMRNVKFVDLLKMRVGYGTSGNDGISNIAAKPYFGAVRYSLDGIGLQLQNIANTSIQWETVTQRNVGLDGRFFNDRLSISFDLFNNTTNNLLVQKSLNSVAGIDTYWSNDGKLENRGYEASVNVKLVKLKDFELTMGGSVGHYDNKILALTEGKESFVTSVYGGEILTAVGQPMGQFYGYKTNGVYSTTQEAISDGLSTKMDNGSIAPFKAGDVRFVNQNPSEDKLINEKDKVVIGNSNPDLYGSLNAGLKYKHLGIQCIFNYSYGNDVYNYLRSQVESGSTFYNQTVAMSNRWMVEGQKTNVPRSVYGDPMYNNRFSDRWIEDGSYLRLKTVEVTYELPLKVSFIQGLTFWASANNLWTLTKYLGADPEFSISNQIMYQGIDAGVLPQSRSYFGGVKIYL